MSTKDKAIKFEYLDGIIPNSELEDFSKHLSNYNINVVFANKSGKTYASGDILTNGGLSLILV